MWNRIIPLIALSVFLAAGCSSKGSFGYKKYDMDTYRDMGPSPEFSASEKIDWVYKFPSSPGKRRMTIVVYKKELVWAEVKKDTQNTEKDSPFVHGKIEGFEPGEYRIVIVDVRKIVAEQIFTIFNPDLPEKE